MGVYNHGVEVLENATRMSVPVTGTSGLQVVFGTAPIHTKEDYKDKVNKPIIAYTYEEAVEKMGYSEAWDKYTICQSIEASKLYNVYPIVFVNVLDPEKNCKAIETVTWKPSEAKEYSFASADIIVDTIEVSADAEKLTKDTDYILTVDTKGFVTLSLLSNSAHYNAETLTISAKEISYEKEDMITQIVGGYSASEGRNTGISCVNDVFPIHQLTPGLLLAPGFSQNPEVSLALQMAAMNISGEFYANSIIDIDCSENGATKCEDFHEQKEAQGVVDANSIALWPKVKSAGKTYYYSAIYGAAVAYMDASNGDVPNLSPSNKALNITATVLENGDEIQINKLYANNYVNAYGGVTAINYAGWKMWGNNTAAYPTTTDPKDRWICARRFFNYYRNHLILTTARRVDDLGNFRLLEAICDDENVWFNSMKSKLYIAGGKVSYNEDDNPIENIMDGTLTFRVKLATYLPAKHIKFEVEFDPTILQEALSA